MNIQKITYRQFIGAKGEDAAVKLLNAKGFTVLRRNYGYYPDSVEYVAGAKRNRIIRTAEHFVMENGLYDKNIVFEICMVTHDKQGNIRRIDFVPF